MYGHNMRKFATLIVITLLLTLFSGSSVADDSMSEAKEVTDGYDDWWWVCYQDDCDDGWGVDYADYYKLKVYPGDKV